MEFDDGLTPRDAATTTGDDCCSVVFVDFDRNPQRFQRSNHGPDVIGKEQIFDPDLGRIRSITAQGREQENSIGERFRSREVDIALESTYRL